MAVTIHVIGDSHADSYKGFTGFAIHCIGRATAHNVCKDNSSTNSKQKIQYIMDFLSRGSVILFTLGEIDCRVHIYQKHVDSNHVVSIETLIDDTVSRYLNHIKGFTQHIIAVASIPPAGYEGNAFNYPFYGSPEIRAYINKTFNETLRNRCKELNIPYIDIYDATVLSDGMANPTYLRDRIHYNHKALELVKQQLKEMKLWK